jgi:predicted  nucleic acid-binding Zn-ribbon protein
MYAGGQARDAKDVESAVRAYGAAPGGQAMMKSEQKAAEEAMASGIYVTWQSPDERECCRIQSNSSCLCGHALKSHDAPKGGGTRLRPPGCSKCGCSRFRYAPTRPEECGQWWLPRRKDFDVKAWRARVRKNPQDYACLNCDQKVSDHEAVFETERARSDAGRPVREAFAPLASTPQLQALVLGDEQEDDLEALAASGAISAAAYHRRIASAAALAAPGGAPYAATNVGVAPPPRGRGAYVRKR